MYGLIGPESFTDVEAGALNTGSIRVTDATTTALTGTLTAGHLTPVDATAGNATYTLPAASTVPAGGVTAVKKADTGANTVTVQRAGSDVVYGTGAGGASRTVTLPGESVVFTSNGVNAWTVMASDTPVPQLDARYNNTYVPALVATVVGDGSTDDAAAIQAKLTAAATLGIGSVYAPGGSTGVVIIGSTLTLSSGTALRLGAGVTLRRKTGMTGPLIVNAAQTAVRTVSDGAMSSSSNQTTLTSATAAFTSADVGRTVTVAGALATSTPLTANIVSVTDGQNVVLSLAAKVTVSGATVTLYNRDHDLGIICDPGATIDGGANAGAGTNAYHVRIFHADRVTILHNGSRFLSTSGKYCYALGDVTQFIVRDVNFGSFSDGVHINGPAQYGLISGMSGTTGDDMVALTGNDYTTPTYNITAGDISDIEIVNTQCNAAQEAVKVLAGAGCTAKRIRVTGVKGSVLQNPVYLGDDTGQASTTGGTLDEITIEGVHATPGGGLHPVAIFASVGKRIAVRDVAYDNTTNGAGGVVQVQSTASVTNLTVDGVQMVNTGTGTPVVKVDGTVTDLQIRGVHGTLGSSSPILSATAATSVVTRASIVGCHFSGGNAYVQTSNSAATVPLVEIAGCSSTTSAWLADLNTTTELHVAATSAQGLTAGVINVGANGTVTVRGDLKASASNLNITSGGHVRCISPSISLDVSKLDKNNGDMVFNSNAAAAPFVTGPAVCDGTQWRALTSTATKTGTATLVGGTVTVSDTSITANSVIRLAYKTAGGTPGAMYISARSAGASFTITSTSGTDTSVLQYYIDAY